MSNAMRVKERETAIKKSQQQKSRKRKKKALAAFLIILLVTVAALGVLSVTYFFKISTITVEGSFTYAFDDIINTANIELGDNLLILSEKDISKKLSKRLPFVESISLEKTFPDKLKIIVNETKEELCFKTKNKVFSSNKKGKILKEYETAPITLPFIKVSDKTSFTLGEKVVFSTENEAEVAEKYLDLFDSCSFNINFINITDPYDSYLKIENRFIVKMGSATNLEYKAAHMDETVKKMADDASGIFNLTAWTQDKKSAFFSEQSIVEILE